MIKYISSLIESEVKKTKQLFTQDVKKTNDTESSITHTKDSIKKSSANIEKKEPTEKKYNKEGINVISRRLPRRAPPKTRRSKARHE